MHCRKERIYLTDLTSLRDQTNAFVMKFKALEQLIFGVVVQPRCVVDHESLLLILKLTADCVRVCPWTYAYTLAAIHAVNMRDKFENFINFIFNNQCTIDC